MSNYGRRRVVGLVAAGVVLARAGAASAADAGDSATIYACVEKGDGDLRWVDGPGECRKNEMPIAWGSQGAAGPAGPQGSPGVAGQSVVGSSVAPGDPSCPYGGSKFTVGSAAPTYACNGAPGNNGNSVAMGSAPASACPFGGTAFMVVDGSGAQIGAASFACNGPSGATGPAGAQGATGVQGPPGPAGADGAPGAQGPAGPPGPAGAQGPQGPGGTAGATGAQGPQGPAGPPGPPGAATPYVAPAGWQAFSPTTGRFVFMTNNLRSRIWETDPSAWRPQAALLSGQGIVGEVSLLVGIGPTGGPVLYEFSRDSIDNKSAVREFDLGPANYGQLISEFADVLGAHFVGHADAAGYATSAWFELVKTTIPGSTASQSDLLVVPRGATSAASTLQVDTLVTGFGAPNGFDLCPGGMSGLAHDPTTMSVLFGDTCNGVVWVLGYTTPNGPLSVKGVLQPPSLGQLAYDPTRHVLWSGAYGIPVDLSTF